jgi:hypothetical protein
MTSATTTSPTNPANTGNAAGVTRLGHVNILAADHNAAMEHWRRLFDAEFFLFMYVPEVTSVNSLGVIGDTCLEFFAPWDAGSMLGQSLARRGPGPFAIEFTVADYDRAAQAVTERGARITHPGTSPAGRPPGGRRGRSASPACGRCRSTSARMPRRSPGCSARCSARR